MGKDNTEQAYPNNDIGRTQYDAAMDGTEGSGKGVHIYRSPNLWRENNPISIKDNPTENFVPTPEINAGEDELSHKPWKKWVKIGLLVLFVAFMIYAFIAQLIESQGVLKLGDLGYKQMFP